MLFNQYFLPKKKRYYLINVYISQTQLILIKRKNQQLFLQNSSPLPQMPTIILKHPVFYHYVADLTRRGSYQVDIVDMSIEICQLTDQHD